MLVKNWLFQTDGNAASNPFTHIEGEYTDQNGAPGQGNENPPGGFFNHFILRYKGKYYDPSYGNGPFDSYLDWENASLDGFQKACDSNEGDVIVHKQNEPDLIETLFK